MCIGVPVRETAPVVDEWISNAAAGGSSEELDGEGDVDGCSEPSLYDRCAAAFAAAAGMACSQCACVSQCAICVAMCMCVRGAIPDPARRKLQRPG